MVELTIEQQRALALAKARRRRKEKAGRGFGGGSSAGGGATDTDRGVMATIKDNVIGVDDGVQSYGESLGTWLNRAGDTATLGVVGDEASAAVTIRGLD